MISLSIIELIPIIRSLIFKFGASSLLGIPVVLYIFKTSGILDQKDTENHLKMFKALNVDKNNIEYFLTLSLLFSLIIKIINMIV